MAKGLFVPMYCDLFDHPKLFRLAKHFSGGVKDAYFHLSLLWAYAMKYFPDGIIIGKSDVIANACRWTDDPHVFVNALIQSGFLDITEDGYALHDWSEYGGKLYKTQVLAMERMKRHRASKSDVTATLQKRFSSRIEQELEQEEKIYKKEPPSSIDSERLFADENSKEPKEIKPSSKQLDSWAEQLYQAYPLHVGHAKAVAKIRHALNKATFQELFDAVQAYAASGKVRELIAKGEKNYIPHPQTWFHQERWKDDRSAWQADGTTVPSQQEAKDPELQRAEQYLDRQIKYLSKDHGLEPSILANWIRRDDPNRIIDRFQAKLPRLKLDQWQSLLKQRNVTLDSGPQIGQ